VERDRERGEQQHGGGGGGGRGRGGAGWPFFAELGYSPVASELVQTYIHKYAAAVW